MSPENLKEKVIVVAGGGGLLGSDVCRGIAEAGGIPVVLEKDRESLDRALNRIESLQKGNERPQGEICDITRKDDLNLALERIASGLGGVDAVVNSAYPRNKNFGRKFEDVEYSDFCENINMHLGGYFVLSQVFAEYFRHTGGGTIVNLASIYGFKVPRFGVYEGTNMTVAIEYPCIKAAVIQMTAYLARYYAKTGVRFVSVSPGGILDRQPEGFVERYNQHGTSKGMLLPQDVTSVILFLLSDASKYINGQNIVVDDGWTL